MFPNDGLTYMYKSNRIYFFITSLLITLISIGTTITNFSKNSVWWNIIEVVGALFFILLFIHNFLFLLGKDTAAKKTREERFRILKEGYEQGRFEEDIERTYGYGKYEKGGLQ